MLNPPLNGKIQGLFKAFECFSSTFQGNFNLQGLFKTVLYNQVLVKPVRTLQVIQVPPWSAILRQCPCDHLLWQGPNYLGAKFHWLLYKGNGDALDIGNYRGIKLTEQAMKILERIVDGLIRQEVSIDDSQFGFVPGRGTTDAIFVVLQLQEKYLAVNKRLYMVFVDLEKA